MMNYAHSKVIQNWFRQKENEENQMKSDRFIVRIGKEHGSDCVLEDLTSEQAQFLYDVICTGHKVQYMEVLQVVKQMIGPEAPMPWHPTSTLPTDDLRFPVTSGPDV